MKLDFFIRSFGWLMLCMISFTHAQQLNGIGLKKAQAIIDYRVKQGKFKNIEELNNVKGIGPKLFEKNKNLIRV